MSRLSVKMRILALCLIPLLALIYMGSQDLANKYQNAKNIESVAAIADRLPAASFLVSNLQTERGLSSGFLKSAGWKFGDELKNQLSITDVAIESFHAAFTELNVGELDAIVLQASDQAALALESLAEMRQRVLAQGIMTDEMTEYYTKIIASLLNIAQAAAHVADDAMTVQRLVALDSLLQGKELAGRERAIGGGGFSSGLFGKNDYTSFNSMTSMQEFSFQAFRAFAEPKLSELFKEATHGAAAEEVERLREVVRASAFSGAIPAGSDVKWFDATTARINALNEIENAANVELANHVHDASAVADAALYATLTLNGVIVLLTMIVAFLVMRSITMPLARLTTTMGQFAGGNFEEQVAGTQNTDELGEMARAVAIFRENGIKVSNLSAEEEERLSERTRERAEMMGTLQRAFGVVVDAAVGGDFSQRVTDEFPDAELNELASGVNKLVETVDRGLNESGQVLAALADTDLTLRVEGHYEGAFLRLKSDTNAVADKLTEVIGQLRETSRGVKTATGEILAGANDLSERTTKQAATIEETSAAMEQLSSTVVTNAKQAEEASNNSRAVSQTAEAGGLVMNEANAAMERITSSSSKISNIIGMIDDIAFQTNLLALNASVEAARAGEAGKGFAVVAVEVRRLAQSAAEASSDVKKLVEQSASEVQQGSKLVGDASEKLKQILEAVQSNGTLITSIANASREQASAIDEVNIAVRQMDEMTQHNAALVEETNAAIEQTEAQANELDRIVEIFKLKDSATRSAPMATKPAVSSNPQATKKAYLSRGNAAIDTEWAEF